MVGKDFAMIVHYKDFAFKGEVLVQYILWARTGNTTTLAFRLVTISWRADFVLTSRK